MSGSRTKILIGFAITFVFIAAFLVVVIMFGLNTGEIQELESVEVTEYRGTDLSSIDDFRENSIRGPQHIDIEQYQLKITGLVERPISYTYDEVISDHRQYEKTVRLNCVEGWSVNILWEGFLVRDLIEEVKSLPGAEVVIFRAHDGYSTSFPLEYVMNNDIIMAYKMNEVTIPPQRGFPCQLVAESRWGYKWIKWITEIELSDDVDYRGYWGNRGYSHEGDLDKSFLGK